MATGRYAFTVNSVAADSRVPLPMIRKKQKVAKICMLLSVQNAHVSVRKVLSGGAASRVLSTEH